MICAAVVLPMPGGPDTSSAFLPRSSLAPRAPGAAAGVPPCKCTRCQSLSHCRMVCWPPGLPTRSAALRGFHLSTHSWLPALGAAVGKGTRVRCQSWCAWSDQARAGALSRKG